MIQQELTDDQLDQLDPDKVCVAHDSGDGDLYVTSGRDLLKDHPSGKLSKALDDLLDGVRRDSFEIIAVNENGILVEVTCI